MLPTSSSGGRRPVIQTTTLLAWSLHNNPRQATSVAHHYAANSASKLRTATRLKEVVCRFEGQNRQSQIITDNHGIGHITRGGLDSLGHASADRLSSGDVTVGHSALLLPPPSRPSNGDVTRSPFHLPFHSPGLSRLKMASAVPWWVYTSPSVKPSCPLKFSCLHNMSKRPLSRSPSPARRVRPLVRTCSAFFVVE